MKVPVQSLYETFSEYRSLVPVTGVSVPQKRLEDLSHNDLYSCSAHLWHFEEEVDVFKHYLPRLLELCTVEPATGSSWAMKPIFESLRNNHWQSWPITEAASVDDFVKAWWQSSVNFRCDQIDVWQILSAISTAYPSVKPFLDFWSEQESTEALLNFIESTNVLISPWGLFSTEAADEIRTWLLSDKTLSWLQKHIGRRGGEPMPGLQEIFDSLKYTSEHS